jgi:putative PIN family toxin of toxin-antitoxin system
MRLVVDTNVIVAGLLSPSGPPAAIVMGILSGELRLLRSVPIWGEYCDVLARPKFRFPVEAVEDFLGFVEYETELVVPARVNELPDADDTMFLAAAVGGAADYVVTGNVKHYPTGLREGVKVVTPAEFVRLWQGER